MVFGIQPVERVQALPALLRVSPLYDAGRFRRRQRRRAMPIPLSIIYERSLSVKEENKNIVLSFRVTPEERKMIDRRMEQAGISNMAAYLRKMAIDGYVVKLELPELRDFISLLRRTSNNFNQIARRVNSTDRIYADDIAEMKNLLEQIWEADNRILEKLAAID